MRLSGQEFNNATSQSFAVLQIGYRPESIVFQFKNVIGMIERLFDQAKPHWAHAWKHIVSLANKNGSFPLRKKSHFLLVVIPTPPRGNRPSH